MAGDGKLFYGRNGGVTHERCKTAIAALTLMSVREKQAGFWPPDVAAVPAG